VIPVPIAHGHRADELAEERGGASLSGGGRGVSRRCGAHGRRPHRAHECAQAGARARSKRRTALWYEARILATLADARLAAGDRSGARALFAEAPELVDQGRGWRVGAFHVALAWVRLLALEPAPDRTGIESALESLDALRAELDADPYQRIAALERARLAT
jgi:hypothetical protein